MQPTLSPHNRTFARNIELLRKSREDSQVDAALRNRKEIPDDSFDHALEDMDPADQSSDSEDFEHHVDDGYATETPMAAYYSITKSWHAQTSVVS